MDKVSSLVQVKVLNVVQILCRVDKQFVMYMPMIRSPLCVLTRIIGCGCSWYCCWGGGGG